MVRDLQTFYPRKDEMGNGPIELVLGNVLDKVSERTQQILGYFAESNPRPPPHTAVVTGGTGVVLLTDQSSVAERGSKIQRRDKCSMFDCLCILRLMPLDGKRGTLDCFI